MVGQDDFFNKLLGETYSLIEREVEPAPIEKLADYFDKKYTESQVQTSKFGLVYFIENLNIFRVRFAEVWLDFPANWSIFAKLSHNLQLKMNTRMVIDHDHHDKLCQILGISEQEVIIVSSRNGAVTLETSARSIQENAA